MRLSYACYGNTHSFVQMNCPWGSRIAVRRVAFGAKSSSKCPAESTENTQFECCVPTCGDCLVEDSGFRSGVVDQSLCAGKTACSVRAQRALIPGCGNRRLSHYILLMYDCVPDFMSEIPQRRVFNRTVSEEVCSIPTFNHPDIVWSRLNASESPSSSWHIQPKTNKTYPIPTLNPTFNSGTKNNLTLDSLEATREGAIIGALVGGLTLLVIAVLALVICCTIRWKSGEEKPDNRSNMRLADPVTAQPSYYAYGSVDGSSMAGQGQSDDASVWSVSTDPCGSADDNRVHVTDYSVQSSLDMYNQTVFPGFAPAKPPALEARYCNHHSDATTGRLLGEGNHRNRNALSNKGGTSRKSTRHSVSHRGCSHTAYNNSSRGGIGRTKDSYYTGKSQAMRQLALDPSNRHLARESPEMETPAVASWWLMGAMRTNSDPIMRFQQKYNDRY